MFLFASCLSAAAAVNFATSDSVCRMSILLPIFNGSNVVDELLGDLLNQETIFSACRVELVVGLEPTDDAAATHALIRDFGVRARDLLSVTVFAHRERLGWSRNVNFLYGASSG